MSISTSHATRATFPAPGFSTTTATARSFASCPFTLYGQDAAADDHVVVGFEFDGRRPDADGGVLEVGPDREGEDEGQKGARRRMGWTGGREVPGIVTAKRFRSHKLAACVSYRGPAYPRSAAARSRCSVAASATTSMSGGSMDRVESVLIPVRQASQVATR